eukprot:Nk52_evm7s235 gene=Nk52_evmTU7s235
MVMGMVMASNWGVVNCGVQRNQCVRLWRALGACVPVKEGSFGRFVQARGGAPGGISVQGSRRRLSTLVGAATKHCPTLMGKRSKELLVERRGLTRCYSQQPELVEVGQFVSVAGAGDEDCSSFEGETSVGDLERGVDGGNASSRGSGATVPEALAPGTFFVHKLFGYRGVILDSWLAEIYTGHGHGNPFELTKGYSTPTPPRAQDRAGTLDSTPSPTATTADRSGSQAGSGVQERPYYVALVDSRDQAEQGTSFAYVSHSHALPYHTDTPQPLDNYLFTTFLLESKGEMLGRPQPWHGSAPSYPEGGHTGTGEAGPESRESSGTPPPSSVMFPRTFYSPTKNLTYLQTRHQQVLQYSKVFRQVTAGIEITVIPFYMEFNSHPVHNFFMWAYVITMQNIGSTPVRLLNRHWHIVDGAGKSDEVVGPGVIGKYPVLHPGQPAFEYTSHVNMSTPHGRMFGWYEMEETTAVTPGATLPNPATSSRPPNRNSFKVCVPTFILDSPHRHRFGVE